MVALGERSTPNGQELLAEFIQYGQQKPFEEIVRRYAGMVFNVCYRITKDKHEAEDATQAVFLTLALQAKRGTEIKALGPWLQQVGKRLSLDVRRSKKRRLTREERHHSEQTLRRESLLDDALPSADLDELKTVLHEELQKLPAKYRLPLILHYFGGLSRDEMAAELNCKPSTLGVRIFRGREMLAGRLSSRGINISTTALGVMLGFAVKRAVSESLISATSHAATAIMAGRDAHGAGMASAHVIGLTRRASSALAIGKVRAVAVTLMLASTSLGAGAKALGAMGIIPQINVGRLISDELERLMRPLFAPVSLPILRVDARTKPVQSTVASAPPDTSSFSVANLATVTPRTAVQIAKSPVVTPAAATVASSNTIIKPTIAMPVFATNWSKSTDSHPITLASSKSVPSVQNAGDFSASTATGAGGGGGSSGLNALSLPAVPPARVNWDYFSKSSIAVGSSNNLYVAPAGKSSSGNGTASINSGSSTDPVATPATLVGISSTTGSVTQSSTGVVRGWGQVDRTGTLDMNGKVVADGEGVDRTLNLTSFTSIQTSVTPDPVATGLATIAPVQASTSAAASLATPATASQLLASSDGTAVLSADAVSTPLFSFAGTSWPSMISTPPAASGVSGSTFSTTTSAKPVAASAALSPAGWYAINRGRLSLPLVQCPTDPLILNWGDNAQGGTLALVNSVRIALTADGNQAMINPSPLPIDISLLASDRADIPSLSEISGQTIGLWQVDPSGPDIASADLTIHYDMMLADELGASANSIELWTYGNNAGKWQTVDPSTFALDSTNGLVSGYGTDIDYFAVSVGSTGSHDVNQLIAEHLAQTSGEIVDGSGAQGVPEPIGLPLLLAGAGLLGRRRRRA